MQVLVAAPVSEAAPPSEGAGRRGALRSIFSFPVVLGGLLVLLTMFTIRSRFNDPDMWWHLKTGEIIWTTHAIPKVDLFSFTAFGHAWTAQEWLSELTLYGAFKFGGYTGLMLWFSVLACLLILAAYLLATLYSGNCKVAFLGGVVVWLFSTIGLAIRPHMIGYLLLICELLVIHLGRKRSARWLLTLPPIFALWINFHSSFFFGLAVLGLVLFFSFVEFRAGLLVSTRWPVEKRKMLAIAFALSTAALFLNPNGFRQVWYPLDTMLKQNVGRAIVSEWQQTNFGDFRALALLAAGALILLIPLLRRIELEAIELILVALGFELAVQHERMLFVFGILAAPVLCRLLATAWDGYDWRRDNAGGAAIVLGLVAVIAILVFPGQRSIEQQIEAHNPVQAVEFVKRAGLSGNMLNEYVFGGYLIWAAPEHKIFVDGRSDVFEWNGVLQDYAKWTSLATDPNTILDKYRIRYCLIAQDSPMDRVLALLPGWKQVYSDDRAVVFVRQKA